MCFVPKIPMLDSRFFDPLNTWYIYDNKPLKESWKSLPSSLYPQALKMMNLDSY